MLTSYKRIHWFNSDFHSGFLLNDNQKITEISFDVNPFQIDVNNNLKVVTYIRDSTQSKPIQIKLKEPYNQSREVFNADNEAFPIIYTNHTGTEGMNTYYPYSIARLIPQQIPRFTFRVDDNYNSFLSSSGTDVIYRIFNYTGTIQTFNVPTGVSSVNVYCWGAGGASGLLTQSGSVNGRGGFGGFVKATLTIPNGTTSFKVIVGQGGRKDNGGSAFGGGGEGYGDTGTWKLGSGGGLSGIFVDNANMTMTGNNINSLATAVIIAGGGGAGGSQNVGTAFNDGGNGGSSTGNDGSTSGGATIATGGSQSAGGTFDGALFTGGSKIGNYQAGGGGGYYGGGRSSPGSGTVAGGGGGSSYLNISSYTITNITNLKNATNGTLSAPGNTESYYQAGIGIGGITVGNTTASVGGDGLVVIEYFRKRIEGITPDETLIQATNANIPVTVNSQYQINYQTPIVLPKGTYESIFNNGSILFRNKKFPRPWGAYFAENWSGTTLLDSSGNGRHATTAGTIYSSNLNGNGANAPITYLSGTTTSSITWPTGSIPSTFTILTLARWDGTTQANYQRIFDGGSGNWFQGHIDLGGSLKQIGGAFYNNLWITTDQPTTSLVPSITDWVCMIGKNSGTAPNNILANGIARGINTGGTSGSPLTINNGTSIAQRSNWAFSVAIIWDTALSDEQMYELNRLINDYKNTGISIKNDLGLNFDYSYPILKDANNNQIKPLAWYPFDGSTASLINDASGNGYNLTNTGVTISSNNFIKGNGSAELDGSTNYFSSLNPNLCTYFSQQSYTITLWLYPKSTTNGLSFSVGGNQSSGRMWLGYGVLNTGKYEFSTNVGVSGDLISASTYSGDLNNWIHLAFVYNKDTQVRRIYRNGVSIANDTSSVGTITQNVFYIGRIIDANTLKMNGLLDDFRIYDFALTATQVSELYNGRLSIYNPPGFILGTEIEPE